MSPAEFRCLSEFLGLTPEWVAARLAVGIDELSRWATGDEPGRDYVANEIASIATMTAKLVHERAAAYRWGGTIVTYRSDEEFRAADPFGLTYPASWHRAVAARVAHRSVDIHITYPAEARSSRTEGGEL